MDSNDVITDQLEAALSMQAAAYKAEHKAKLEAWATIAELEVENAKLREELQHHYGSSDCSCEPWEVSDEPLKM